MKQSVELDDGKSWEKRLVTDQAEHLVHCQICRSKPILDPGDILFGMKNGATRKYVHIIASSIEDGLRKLKWAGSDLVFSVILDTGTRGPAMSDATKARLREIGAQRRAQRLPVTPRPKKFDPRHAHNCTECQREFFHTSTDCAESPLLLMCIDCGIKKGNQKMVLTQGRSYDKVAVDATITNTANISQKGELTMNKWTKEFIDGQVLEKGEKGEPVLNSDSLFKLAKANDVDANKYRKDFKSENAGRIRMTIGNMLRGAAVRNGKLITLGGASKLVPPELLPKPKEKKAKAPKKAKKKKAA